MKRILAAVMALVMIVTVVFAMNVSTPTVASAEDKDLGMTDNGGIQVSALDGYDELVITVKNTNETSGRTGWGIGGICFGGWSVDDAFACTPTDLPAGGTESFTFAVADILAKCEEKGCSSINLNFYNDCKVASAILKTASEIEEKDLGRKGNGGIAVDAFKDYDKLLVTVKNTGDSGRAGWGIGGICFNNSWSADAAFSPKATSLDPGAEYTFEFSIADILAKCAETGDTSVNLCYYNNCEVVSAVAVREAAAPTPEPTATSTPTPKPTATSTPTPKPTATNTPTPEPTATSTPTPEPTATSTPTPEPTATNTPTPEPTATSTPTPKPTATNTPTPKPTATNTPTPEPTATSTPTPEPTATSTPTPEPTATSTPTPEPTATSTPTPEPTATSTPTPEPTATSTPTPEPTATSTPTPEPTATSTPTPEEEVPTPTPEEEEATPTPEEEEPTAAPTEAPAADNASGNDSAPTTGDAVSFAILFGAAVIALLAVVAVKKSRA